MRDLLLMILLMKNNKNNKTTTTTTTTTITTTVNELSSTPLNSADHRPRPKIATPMHLNTQVWHVKRAVNRNFHAEL